ncbi:MAG: GAP family protein, partial [Microlunatus sp.]|nr:GAP family protein [Microlunatus sp.]
MLTALGHVLPIAVVVALSSVPITATILILVSPRAGQTAIPFAIGWVVGLALVVIAAAAFGSSLPISTSRDQQTAIGVGEILIGLALLAVAVVLWRRGRHHQTTSHAAWLDKIGAIGPLAAVGVAAVLNIRPKGLLLGLAAGLSVAGDTTDLSVAVVAIACYVALAASTVVVPVVLTLVSPTKMQPRLTATRAWLDHHSRTVTLV